MRFWRFLFALGLGLGAMAQAQDTGFGPPVSVTLEPSPKIGLPKRNWIDQTKAEADAKSAGCIQCHQGVEPMHKSPNVVLGCIDCHGGNARRNLKKEDAHIMPLNPERWPTAANPPNSNVLLNHESPEFIQFMNPGDLRAARNACGLCHGDIIDKVDHSMMNTGPMLWGAALYNNGGFSAKNYVFGQAYGPKGEPLTIYNPTPVTPELTHAKGILPYIAPVPRFNLGQPGNVLRIFEKGGEVPLQLGVSNVEELPGKPARRLSERGLGTLNRTDPVFLGIQKTRLHDPLLGFLGSNDHPGDYRSSGCTACHVVYANDRSPTNSGFWSVYGHQGLSFMKDPTIPKNERGHPIKHELTRSVPSSQCMNCHMHQGNLFVNPYLGYTWWDQETDAAFMYPKVQKDPTDQELVHATTQNPEAAAARGLWGDLDFLEKVAELNPKLKHTQFADYHGHGWIFKAAFKKDRKGNWLDINDNVVSDKDPDKFKKAVHLKDIHIAKGMQCVDCHFLTDVHGDGNLYGEPRNAITIGCIDCHGTVGERPTLMTTGPPKQVDLNQSSTPWGPRFQWVGNQLFQYSTMEENKRWEIPQTMDVIDPLSSHYNAKARYAKTLQRDGKTWGDVPGTAELRRTNLAHDNSKFDCQICHTAWATSCFGCHLPMKANQHVPLNKFEGVLDRNFTTYNPQVVRDDVFMLGIDGTVKKNRMAVIRSSSAVVVGSQNQNREWVYSQQQTVSWEGYSGQAFNPHFAHTTSGAGTTKTCTDCHLSAANDNNAWITQLLGFGTGTVNFFGRYTYVGTEAGMYGVIWTESEEPQAAIGSSFHSIAYPRNFAEHVARGQELANAYEHHGDEINDLTLRGEYLYMAHGKKGVEVFDVANIDQKGFSERIVTSPVSPLGQRTYVHTPFATSVALPGTMANDPLRSHIPANEEQPVHPYWGGIYATDLEEGLVVISAGPLVDGDPENNFFKKGATYNPDGKLTGAEYAVCAGFHVYICTPRGLAVVDVSDPFKPKLVGELTGYLKNPRCVSIQFRYAFVTDDDGLKVIDVSNPIRPRPVAGATVRLQHAHKLYVARTYAYVANGEEGLAIIDVENPEKPKLDQMFNAEGALNDTRAVQIGSVAASMYALVADGHNGLRVIQLISPDTVPGAQGFSPRPSPRLIATYHTHEPALAVSRGLDRDRVVDETGNQAVVFGRRGSRPFHLSEIAPFVKTEKGDFYTVDDVKTQDGNLVTHSGAKLAEPRPMPTPTPEPLPDPGYLFNPPEETIPLPQ